MQVSGVWFAVLGGCCGLLFGLEISVIAGVKDLLGQEWGLGERSFGMSALAAAVSFGAIPGCIASSFGADRLGRRDYLVAVLAVYCAAVVLEALSWRYSLLLTARLVVGSTVGSLSAVAPMFVSEVAPAATRGLLVSVNQLCVCIGILAGFTVNATSMPWQAQLCAGLPVAAGIMLAFMCYTPRSPRWLVGQGRIAEAGAALIKLRGHGQAAELLPSATPASPASSWSPLLQEAHDAAPWDHSLRVQTSLPPHVEMELQSIQRFTAQAVLTWRQMLHPRAVAAVAMGIGLSAMQQLTGVNAVNFYASDMLRAAGFSRTAAQWQAVGIGCVKVVTVLLAMRWIDLWGRRKLLLTGLAGMVLALAILVGLFAWDAPCVGHLAGRAPGWTAVAALWLFMGAYEFGAGPVVWVLLSELYPMQIRGKATTLAAGMNWVFSATLGLLFAPAQQVLCIWGTFAALGAVALVSIVWVGAVLPETKGKSIEDMDALWKLPGRVTSPAP